MGLLGPVSKTYWLFRSLQFSDIQPLLTVLFQEPDSNLELFLHLCSGQLLQELLQGLIVLSFPLLLSQCLEGRDSPSSFVLSPVHLAQCPNW